MAKIKLGIRIVTLAATTLALAGAGHGQSKLWKYHGRGVWRSTGGVLTRVNWDPSKGIVGNMGASGVSYSSAAPTTAQGGANAGNAEVDAAFKKWDALKAIPTVKIKLVPAGVGKKPNVPTTWEDDLTSPGETRNVAINANPMPVVLNLGNAGKNITLRTDRFTIDKAGTRANVIDENDVYSTTVHEVGHVLGLDHPDSARQVMTPNNQSRQTVGGLFRNVENVGAAPNDLSGAALPAGAKYYKDPRATLALGDVFGAATLYSAPLSRVTSIFQAAGGILGKNRFLYRLFNDSGVDTTTGLRTGYDEHKAFIPVADGVDVDNLFAPADWSIARVAGGVSVDYIGPDAGLLPGQTLDFSFDSSALPTSTLPQVRWNLDSYSDTASSFVDDPVPSDPLAFNAQDFGVLDGTYTYRFDSGVDDWVPSRMSLVATPVPEPSAMLAFGVAAAFLRRRRRS